MCHFQINPVPPQLTIAHPLAFNYESWTTPHVSITIEVADNGNPPLLLNRTFLINITDVNEPPENVTLIDSDLKEGDLPGTRIGQIQCYNPDPNEAVSYSVVSNDSSNQTEAQFSVVTTSNGSYLILAQQPRQPSDWRSTYYVTINATDHGYPPMSVQTQLTVFVRLIDPCPQPCGSNAFCDRSSKSCLCRQGFTGQDCHNINDCVMETTPVVGAGISISSPTIQSVCTNNGTCTDLINGFSCLCPDGFTGDQCQHDLRCQSSKAPKCLNNGVCVSSTNGVFCQCPLGFKGTLCETDVDDCGERSCVQGTCVDGIATFSCACFSGFTGSLCSYPADACANNSCSDTEICRAPATTTRRRQSSIKQ